jgi:hypothetical protein
MRRPSGRSKQVLDDNAKITRLGTQLSKLEKECVVLLVCSKNVSRYNFCTSSCLGSENMVVVHCSLMLVKTTKEAQESYRGERVILISQEKVVQEAERKS